MVPHRLLRVIGPVLLALGTWGAMSAQGVAQDGGRVEIDGRPFFLSGGNVAWVDFAHDIGPGPTSLSTFEEVFGQVGDNGGNALRIWLHTNGAHTPAWEDSTVVGPGENAIEDLRDLLDRAWDQNVGLVLTLWSFDMLRTSYGSKITDRAYHLLTDTSLTRTYVENALLPMVEAVSDHPAVIAWEIFNEPAGMSEEHGWAFTRHVPMAALQRFINRTAAAIHEVDSTAVVTNGSWSFISQSDAPPAAALRAARPAPSELGRERLEQIREDLSQKYRHEFTVEQAREAYARFGKRKAGNGNTNYYADHHLIEQGGAPAGTLDVYQVHYYDWAGEERSPFHTDVDHWQLDKPLFVGEFFVADHFGVDWEDQYDVLYQNGYAGALGWQWFDWEHDREEAESWPRALQNMRDMARAHSDDVLIAGEPPPPASFALHQNVPNPFRRQTTIQYSLSQPREVSIEVFDIMGRKVATLVDERQSPGDRKRVSFRAGSLASGVYFYRLRVGNVEKIRKMVVLK